MTGLVLDPVLASRLHLLAGVPALGDAPPTPEEVRRFLAFSASVDGYTAPDTSTTDTVVPGPHGDIPVRVYRPIEGGTQRHLVARAPGAPWPPALRSDCGTRTASSRMRSSWPIPSPTIRSPADRTSTS